MSSTQIPLSRFQNLRNSEKFSDRTVEIKKPENLLYHELYHHFKIPFWEIFLQDAFSTFSVKSKEQILDVKATEI